MINTVSNLDFGGLKEKLNISYKKKRINNTGLFANIKKIFNNPEISVSEKT